MLHMAQVAFSHTAGHSNRCLLPCWGVGHVQLASWQLTVEVPSCSITPNFTDSLSKYPENCCCLFVVL